MRHWGAEFVGGSFVILAVAALLFLVQLTVVTLRLLGQFRLVHIVLTLRHFG